MKIMLAIARHVVVAVAASVLGAVPFVLAGCGDSDSPAAPSALTAAPDASAGGGAPAGPAVGNRTATPASFHADGLKPHALSGFNAYDFEASWDGEHLRLALIEDEMRSMREASKPHRNRMITVETCPVEPHHVLQSCGDPIWRGSRALSGRLELPPVPLASCAGWIVVNAAELSDDRQDGWRNAPCPASDGESVIGSDGTGEGWPEYPEPEQGPTPQSIVDKAFGGGLVAGGGQGSFDVSLLFQGTGDTAGDDYRATSSAPAVATVEVTSNPRVVITPVGAGTTTIGVTFLRTGARVEFDVTVLPLHDLPFMRTDRVGDGVGFDLVSFSITRPDAAGWATVTYAAAGTVDPVAIDVGFSLYLNAGIMHPRSAELIEYEMGTSGGNWDLSDYEVTGGRYGSNDGDPYIRTTQSTAPASSFSFDVRFPPESRNRVWWLDMGVFGPGIFDDLPGDAVEAAGGEIFNGRPATPAVVFGAPVFIEDDAYRVMIP